MERSGTTQLPGATRSDRLKWEMRWMNDRSNSQKFMISGAAGYESYIKLIYFYLAFIHHQQSKVTVGVAQHA
jgi:hypothetical protein